MLQIFDYNQNNVTFRHEDGTVMVNATEMAKPFGKRVNDWLRLGATREFISEFSSTGFPADGLVQIKEGGNGGGTWMHEDLALEFARWLSPAFAIWCNSRIKELMRHGMTATPAKLEELLTSPDLVIGLAQALKDERSQNEILQLQNQQQKKELRDAAPKVEYYEEVLQSQSLILTNVIAKELGLTAVRLNQLLHELGLHYKSGDTWVLYAKYQNQELTGTKTYNYCDSYGHQKTNIHTYWTEKGRELIHSMVKGYNMKQLLLNVNTTTGEGI